MQLNRNMLREKQLLLQKFTHMKNLFNRALAAWKLKSLVMTLVACTFVFSACANNEKIISFSELPLQAQQLVEQHFLKADISVITMDREFLDIDYKVRFSNGSKVEFDKNGELTKADCGMQPVPDAILPEPVRQYVATYFPNDYVTEWKKDDFRWKAELSNKLELIFNRNYQYVGLDD